MGSETMTTPKHILVRSARDRIIDLLGFGETYPLQDVAVEEEQLTVNFNAPCTIGITPGQEDVRYDLCEGTTPVDTESCSIIGNDGETRLPGPIITGDKTFTIRATKLMSGREAFLHQSASVKVGLNTKLRAYLPDLPRLHPELTNPTDADPRITDYGKKVRVRVEGGQAEASYKLEYTGVGGVVISTETVPSNGGDLDLFTEPVEEDTVIRIRATRMSGPPDTALLEAELPLAVRANPALDVAVAIEGSALVDPASETVITIAGSQESVAYSAYIRTLHDEDFLREESESAKVLVVEVPASLDVTEHEVRIPAPERPIPWKTQPGFAQMGNPTMGNGAEQKLALGPIQEDSVLVIKAHKNHFASGVAGNQSVTPGESALQLEQALMALPRPAAAPALALTLTLSPNADGTGGSMLVSGGQRGVFYHFRLDTNGEEIGLPAYFHRLDEDKPEENRGIEQLEISRDFAIARARAPESATPPPDPALVEPPDPIVEVKPLPNGQVSVMAVKARSGVGWAESRLVPVTTKEEP